ncbi:NAD-dependent protein deacetylase SIR4 OS=Batrachochytrium dendrobatidis (strain JAM81 / FGSC 10211) GN=BATDEDRAFT_20316 PE=3 SV=1 [Rhizoctonia solani AG-1 IB]|uniref:NAD-dependent protein deacetylase SIR4 n=1 Tax=Thanatephorus cucumeris (strain AG1-IB / isolate 7/3/14) TaxID=1108050 RepID=A0A0B7FJD2_THACB|nr:NAD-dependent protein deacetylase SIR4 OS=Batrachochytrium dendrobatidis (strain JAM81 / FGSC 10211) GN=BATDEDRAFT_20316 PE=3 SV=1 [Rhizoctonia solani AG-1 IB]
MRITIPTIPEALLSRKNIPTLDVSQASEKVATFLSGGNALIVTGAGVSVESGIRAYRGTSGRYMNPNYKPILYHELVDTTPRGHSFRQRYWSRSYLGYPPVRDAQPNPTHFALAALQWTGLVPRLITQNVDGLHQKAIPKEAPLNGPGHILELHGTLHSVHCKRNHTTNREEFQDELSRLNPAWKDFVDEMARTGTEPRTNPDGDVDIRGVDFSNFVLPVCKTCLAEGIRDDVMKPAVIFFGESIPQEVKQRSFSDVEASDRVLFIGTTLATYSAFRLLKHAVELNKPAMLLNLGPTRAHGVPEVEIIEAASSDVLRAATRALTSNLKGESGRVVSRLLESGVVIPPPDDLEDRAPRAAG